MSQENVERGLHAFEAFNRRDLDAFLGFMDPEGEFTTRFLQLEGGTSTADTMAFASGGRTFSRSSPTSGLTSLRCATPATP